MIIFQQAGLLEDVGFAPPSHPSEVLILFAAGVIGAPGAIQLLALRSAGRSTGEASPLPASEAPRSSSPGASSGTADP